MTYISDYVLRIHGECQYLFACHAYECFDYNYYNWNCSRGINNKAIYYV